MTVIDENDFSRPWTKPVVLVQRPTVHAVGEGEAGLHGYPLISPGHRRKCEQRDT